MKKLNVGDVVAVNTSRFNQRLGDDHCVEKCVVVEINPMLWQRNSTYDAHGEKPDVVYNDKSGIYAYEYIRDPDGARKTGVVLVELSREAHIHRAPGTPGRVHSTTTIKFIRGFRKQKILGTWAEHEAVREQRMKHADVAQALRAAQSKWDKQVVDAILAKAKLKVELSFNSYGTVRVSLEDLARALGITVKDRPA